MYADDTQPDGTHETDGFVRPDGLFLRRERLISSGNAALRARTVHAALVDAELPPLAWRVMMWVLHETLDRGARTVLFPHKAVAADLGLGQRNAKNLGRAFRALVKANLIEYQHGTKGERVSCVTVVSHVGSSRSVVLPASEESTHEAIAESDVRDETFERARRALGCMSRAGLPHVSLGKRNELAQAFSALPARYTRSSAAMVWTVGAWAGANDDRLLGQKRVDEMRKAGRPVPKARVTVAAVPDFCDERGLIVPDEWSKWQDTREDGSVTLGFSDILHSAKASAQSGFA